MTTQAPRNPQEARALGMEYRRPMKGLFGSTAMPTQAQPRQSGLQRAAGIFADFAAGMNGRAGPYAAMQAERRQSAEAESMRQRARADDFTDWQRREEYQRANPMPSTAQPYRWESNDGDVYQLDPATNQPTRVFDDPSPRLVVGADGRYYPMTQQSAEQDLGETLPEGWTIQGGATGNRGGTFPR